MTTPEHAMVGICCVVAAGLDRRYGWQIAAMAGVAGASPDWDGITIVLGMETMDVAHRVWGHNLLIAAVVAAVWALVDYRWDVVTRMARGVGRLVTLPLEQSQLTIRSAHRWPMACLWLAVAVAVAWIHLPSDMVVSGGEGLTDWQVRPWWPLDGAGYVFPCVSWGDPGLSILFFSGLLAIVARPLWRQPTACLTLLAALAYMAVRRAT